MKNVSDPATQLAHLNSIYQDKAHEAINSCIIIRPTFAANSTYISSCCQVSENVYGFKWSFEIHCEESACGSDNENLYKFATDVGNFQITLNIIPNWICHKLCWMCLTDCLLIYIVSSVNSIITSSLTQLFAQLRFLIYCLSLKMLQIAWVQFSADT